MQNVKATRKGDMLVLEINIGSNALANATASKSGKTRVVGTTHGFTSIEGVDVSLNVTTRAPAPATVAAAASTLIPAGTK